MFLSTLKKLFLLIIFNTSVPGVPCVLPSVQCIKYCTANDNTDVTDQYQQTVNSFLTS